MLSKQILFVDDELHIRHVVRLTFEFAGYKVITANNGFATLVHLAEPPYPAAVIVGDLKPFPETSLGLVNDIRVAFTGMNLPIIVLSTQVTRQDRLWGLAAGADLYLTKPFSPNDLVRITNDLIRRYQAA